MLMDEAVSLWVSLINSRQAVKNHMNLSFPCVLCES